jgi:hypothetical protein
MTTKVSRKLIGVLFAIAMFALSAAPALAGDGGGGQGGGGGLSYESAGPVLFYVAGGFGFGGAGGEGGCGGVYAYNSITGEFLSGAGGSVCY